MIDRLSGVAAIANLLRSFRRPKPAPVAAAVIVAHPDDEVLWAGGEILSHSDWNWYILALCRGNDPDRAPRFWRALNRLNAMGYIADLNDGPEQGTLSTEEVERTILAGLPEARFDLIMTHSPRGEYTQHRRHEEVSQAVIRLWCSGRISTKVLMLFAYADRNQTQPPRADPDAHIRNPLPKRLWERKYQAITEVYGFEPASWEARTTPREEGFWRFDSPQSLDQWLTEQGIEV